MGPFDSEGEAAAVSGEEDRGRGGIAGEVENAGGAGDVRPVKDVSNGRKERDVFTRAPAGSKVEERVPAEGEFARVIGRGLARDPGRCRFGSRGRCDQLRRPQRCDAISHVLA